jgi:hypothetical protein
LHHHHRRCGVHAERHRCLQLPLPTTHHLLLLYGNPRRLPQNFFASFFSTTSIYIYLIKLFCIFFEFASFEEMLYLQSILCG